jgi:DNA-binding YbaB/EbfC family protein
MLKNLGGMMKQLQEAQKRATQIQEELAETRIETSAGGGLVTCVVDGMGQVMDLKVNGEALGLDADDTEMLQDTILAAVQEAVRTAQEQTREKMDELTGGLPLPPGFGI